MSRLTTHILDTAHGQPAAGMLVELRRPPSDTILFAGRSNTDGHCSRALLQGADFIDGEYELVFHVAEYFRARGVVLPDPPFLDRVVLRIGLSPSGPPYHVPLLVSPWSCSMYRGS